MENKKFLVTEEFEVGDYIFEVGDRIKIIEMPHYVVKGQYFDLELEKHISGDSVEFFTHLKNFIRHNKELIQQMVDDDYLKLFTLRYYTKELWNRIISYLNRELL